MRKIRQIFTFGMGLALVMVAGSVFATVRWEDPLGQTHAYSIIYAEGISWGDALNLAGQAGWNLATITSQEEQEVLETTIYADAKYDGKYWLGGYQTAGASGPGENWNWVTGELWDYTNWGQSQPDNWNNEESWLLADTDMAWEWVDFRFSSPRIVGLVVERSVPEPSTLFLLGAGLLGFGARKRLNALKEK